MQMNAASTIMEQIRNYVSSAFLGDSDYELAVDTPLLGLNIIDSFSILELVGFLHQDLGVSVPIDQIKPENFSTIESITQMIDRLACRADEG